MQADRGRHAVRPSKLGAWSILVSGTPSVDNGATSETNKAVKERRTSLTLLLLLAAAAASNPIRAETPTPVGVSTARSAPIHDEVALNGDLVARRLSRLSSEVDGLVVEVLVDDGDWVDAGDVIVRLDSRIAQIERDSATARVDQATARAHETERQYRELLRLKDRQHVAATTVDAAKAQMDIEAAAGRQADSALARAMELLRQHSVVAPFAGVVQRKLVESGEWIETNTAIAELVDVAVLRLDVSVPQYYYRDVDVDTSAVIQLDAMPERTFEAKVTTKVAVGDTASRTFRVRIDVPNDEHALAPGMSARVTLRIADQNQAPALLLPRDAVVRKPDGSTNVWVIVVEDGITKAVPREIETGRSFHDHVEILAGDVNPGQEVVVRGNEILRPGQSVLVAKDKPKDI